MCVMRVSAFGNRSLPEFERAGVQQYFRLKRCEEEKEKMNKQADSVLQDKLDNMLHGSAIVSQ